MAVIVFLGLIPFFVIISIFILLIDGRPVFYYDPRMGKRYKLFKLMKFRTMYLNKGPKVTQNNDKRISRLGFLLRKIKLDEIPQIINIIKGDMVFIGPRPESYEIASSNIDFYKYLDNTIPGISDVTSILFRNESSLINGNWKEFYFEKLIPIKSELTFLQIKNISFIYKIKIFVITLVSICNYNFSIYLIDKYILDNEQYELRQKLNQILGVNRF